MFNFLKEYAQVVGFSRVVLGQSGRGRRPDAKYRITYPIQNDVLTNDLHRASFPPVKKLGGYWNGHPYFLETVNQQEFYLV